MPRIPNSLSFGYCLYRDPSRREQFLDRQGKFQQSKGLFSVFSYALSFTSRISSSSYSRTWSPVVSSQCLLSLVSPALIVYDTFDRSRRLWYQLHPNFPTSMSCRLQASYLKSVSSMRTLVGIGVSLQSLGTGCMAEMVDWRPKEENMRHRWVRQRLYSR